VFERVRLLFTSGYDPNKLTGASSTEGLEALRIFPKGFDQAYIGVGDFYAANLIDPNYVQEPTERLDVVNAQAPLREQHPVYHVRPT
jgi:hypothetical protein